MLTLDLKCRAKGYILLSKSLEIQLMADSSRKYLTPTVSYIATHTWFNFSGPISMDATTTLCSPVPMEI